MQTLIDALNDMPIASLMLVVAIGYSVGRITWRGLSLGPAGGTLGTAILLGSFGLSFEALYGSANPRFTVGALGFALFMYSVGFEAGPRFFGALARGRGLRYVIVGLLVSVLAFGLALTLGTAFDLGPAVTAGVLAGALTSAATYASALEVLRDVPDQAAPLAIAFALVYPIGLVGIVFLIQFLPRLRRRSLAQSLAEEASSILASRTAFPELLRAFRVQKEGVIGPPLKELDLTHRTGCWIMQIHRGESILAASAETRLQPGDHVLVQGRLDQLHRFASAVGPEVFDEDLRNRMPSPRRVVVLARGAAGKTLGELDLPRRFGCLVLSIERGSVRMDAAAETTLERGDVLELAGRRGSVREAALALGRLDRPSTETDIGVYAAGIFLGLLLGRVGVEGFGLELSIGFAGGLLLAGIVFGRLRRIGPFSTHVPRPARQLVRDLGILLFVAEAGVRAGGSSLVGLEGRVVPLILIGVVVSLVPVVTALIVACRGFGMPSVDALGSVSGGMTSTAALATLQRETDGNAPAVSYAAAYAVASVLTAIGGRVLVLLMGG